MDEEKEYTGPSEEEVSEEEVNDEGFGGEPEEEEGGE